MRKTKKRVITLNKTPFNCPLPGKIKIKTYFIQKKLQIYK